MHLTSSLRAIVADGKLSKRGLAEGAVIETRQANRNQLAFIESGWAMKVAYTDDGRRQILKFLMAGDCARCDVLCEDMIDSTSVECITACTVSYIDTDHTYQLISADPNGMKALIEEFAKLSSAAECYIVMLGSYSAEERIAWMVLHLFNRAADAGLTDGRQMPFPLSQPLLASAVGLSLVHTNKTLARLRRDDLLAWSDGLLEIRNLERLENLAQMG